MELPDNYDDEAQQELRRKKRNRAITRTRQSADQAWAACRGHMESLKFIRDRIEAGRTLSEGEAALVRMCVSTVLGELLLRDADLANKLTE